ncbi:MAG: hypothetical protein WBW81_01510 [Methylocella sp.]
MDEPWQGHAVVLRHTEAGDNNGRNGLVIEDRSTRETIVAAMSHGEAGVIAA